MSFRQAARIHSIDCTRSRRWPLIVLLGAMAACQSETPESSTPESTNAPAGTETPVSATTPTVDENAGAPELSREDVFWQSLNTLCDKSFRGQLTIGTEESDREFGYADMVMYSKRCDRNAIDIGFKVDDDDSRTWMFRRSGDGLSLHHRHVDESGKEDETSGYGGMARAGGTSVRQEFPADENTGAMIPAAATNVWAIEIKPGDQFAYELQRIEEQRMFRVVFDLTEPL